MADDHDFKTLQTYLESVTDRILNIDHISRTAREFLSFLDNNTFDIDTKIRVVHLEARLNNIICNCDGLHSRIQACEKGIHDNKNIVDLLMHRISSLTNANPFQR